MQENINVINAEIEKILIEGKELNDLYDNVNAELRNLLNNYDNLNSKKIKLLNILFKHSKKKVLFGYSITNEDKKTSKYIIGVNNAGLGIIKEGDYSQNLSNITDYWAKKYLEDLNKDKNFLKELLKYVKKENRDIIKKCFEKLEKYYNQKGKINNIFFEVNGSCVQFKKDNDYYKDIDILNIDKLKAELDNNDKIKKISNFSYNLRHNDLLEFQLILSNKEDIIKFLNNKLEFFKVEQEKLKDKFKPIEDFLKPYEALEQI